MNKKEIDEIVMLNVLWRKVYDDIESKITSKVKTNIWKSGLDPISYVVWNGMGRIGMFRNICDNIGNELWHEEK